MVNIYWLRPKIGDAVWLWMLLNTTTNFAAQGQPQWFSVLDGKPITDLQIGSALFCTAETVKDWRALLESAGVVRSKLDPDTDGHAPGFEARKYEIVNINFGAQKPETPLASQSVN